MKKQSLVLLAGGILALASCNSGSTGNAEADQAKVDSIVNARVEEIRMQLLEENNAKINQMAQERADSIIAAMTGKPVAKKKAVTNKKETVTSSGDAKAANQMTNATVDEPKTGFQSHSDQDKKQGGFQSHSDQNKKDNGGFKSHSDQNK